MHLTLRLPGGDTELRITLDEAVLGPGGIRMLAPGVWFLLGREGSLGSPACPGIILQPRTLACLPLSRSAGLESPGGCRFLALGLDGDTFDPMVESLALPEACPPVGDAFRTPSLLAPSTGEWRDLSERTACLLRHDPSAGPWEGPRLWTDLQGFLLAFLACRDAHRRMDARGVWTIDDAVAHVEASWNQDHVLADLVAKCAMNTTDFSRRFKEKAGHPLFEYLTRLRIRHACQLLTRTGRSITDIALDCGYRQPSFFNRCFQRITGMSPSEWRGSGPETPAE